MVSNNLFTSELSTFKENNLDKNIISALKELKQIFPHQKLEAKSWNEYYVAIPLEIKVNLPTRGTINNVDIRKLEPIILLFNKKKYPYEAPKVYSNRLDFPKESLPHLNPRSKGNPANFCLYRGNMDVWFIEHSLYELVDKAKSWLEDAASGNLMREYDRFELTRIDEKYGYNVFDYDYIVTILKNNWKLHDEKEGFVFLTYKILNAINDPLIGFNKYSISLEGMAPTDITNLLKINKLVDECKDPQTKLLLPEARYRICGILIWPKSSYISNNYFAELPENLNDLIDVANQFDLNIKDAIIKYLEDGLNLSSDIPLTIVIPRPQKLINYDSNLEFLTFLLRFPDGDINDLDEIADKISVEMLSHRNPLTTGKARDISGLSKDYDCGNVLFIGCGAIGSKMILHFAKNGLTNCSIVDNDSVSPHNIVRFGLNHESLGLNKAYAISKTIEGIFYSDESSVKVEAIKDDAVSLFQRENEHFFRKYQWIIDTSASSLVQQLLTSTKLPDSINCCRCEIANNGKLGIMIVEGARRRPRLDDLQVMIFDMAIDNQEISEWLRTNRMDREYELGSRLQEINIGISCSSETMRLPDELVSLHSSVFIRGFKSVSKKNDFDRGYIQLNFCEESSDYPFYYKTFMIPPTVELKCRNDRSWKIRLCSDSETELRRLFNSSAPSETGGILVGFVNINRKTVYVTRVLPAPPDSISSPYAFVRGVSDVPDQIDQIHDKTGAMLGYVGEWHTHPKGSPQLSTQDESSVAKIKPNLDKVPMPTLVMIVTEKGIYPHIYPN